MYSLFLCCEPAALLWVCVWAAVVLWSLSSVLCFCRSRWWCWDVCSSSRASASTDNTWRTCPLKPWWTSSMRWQQLDPYICDHDTYVHIHNVQRVLLKAWISLLVALKILLFLQILKTHPFFSKTNVYVLPIRSQRRCLRRSCWVPCKLTWHQPSGLQSSCSCCWLRCGASHKPSNPRNSRSCWAPRPSSTLTTSPSKNTVIGF